MPSASRTGQVVEQIVWCGRRIRFAAPCLGQFPDLTRRPAELPAERADECGIAAESKIDGKIDQALAPRRRRGEQPQGAIEPLLLHVARKAAISHQIVLTKCDQVSAADLTACVDATKAALKKRPAAFPETITTSSHTGAGIPELRAAIARLLSERTRPVNMHRSG